MDAPEDADLQVQRASPDLIADLHASLEPFLWRIESGTGNPNPNASAKQQRRIRRRVRARETDRIVALLEPFQELPQLLDPHLQTLVPILAEAFIASLQSKSPKEPSYTKLLIPLSKAICKLLYTFCKIRGEKVIVRFLSTDTKHLELLLSAIEAGDPQVETEASFSQDGKPGSQEQPPAPEAREAVDKWEWEQRYITLLWLSQLLLAPFDLATISSGDKTITCPEIPGLVWPPNTPGVTLRVTPLAIRYLSSSGKERDAAKILLVRIAMRKDMQELGILHALVQWAISCFNPSLTAESKSTYHYIGVLSFLAGILNTSITTSDMDPYIVTIFQILQGDWYKGVMEIVYSSVVARKTVITVLRNICVIVLRSPDSTTKMIEIVETTIGFMFESLADSATPVRLAASKALSLITLKLPTELATQVVDEVIASLMRDVLNIIKGGKRIQDLSLVNPSEWHGLILTLSQLLYRRSPPASSLSSILPALLAGLSFEQRSTSGASIGTNVRDAACFGIWALARRYTTAELQAIDISAAVIHSKYPQCSILQILATELVVTASLDPAGNIRRGSSAALQELIGRHPNTIDEAIQLVQVVDYHAVALRSRAVTEVAAHASQLSTWYLKGVLDGLLGWRGIGDPDASARRTTATVFGSLASKDAITDLKILFSGLRPREDDERHGILLCMASYFSKHPEPFSIEDILEYAANSKHRRIDFIAEAVSRLIISVSKHLTRHELVLELLNKWLRRNEAEVIDATAEAASTIVRNLTPEDQNHMIANWIDIVTENQRGRSGQDRGLISVLFKIFPSVSASQQSIIVALHKRWNTGHDIESRAAILQYLATTTAITSHIESFSDIIVEGLDDYTTNARGDVGSLVRIEAVKATSAIFQTSPQNHTHSTDSLYGKTLRIAAEKLDKVRIEAQLAIAQTLTPSARQLFMSNPCTSKPYFMSLLNILTLSTIQTEEVRAVELLSGYVGSADTGSEDLVRASRAALLGFCDISPRNTELICKSLTTVLKTNLANDRILVPALEVIGFLFDTQIFQNSQVDWKSLHFHVQKSHYKTSNIRKLEAAIHVYGGLAEIYPPAVDKLITMAIHPFPRVREKVVDTLFIVKGVGKGVNWLLAGKADLIKLR